MIDKLRELSEIAPDVCERKGDVFTIGQYEFWLNLSDEFSACYKPSPEMFPTGDPALAWLEYALRAAIEAKEWDYELTCLEGSKLYLASIPKNYWRKDKDDVYQAGWSDGPFKTMAAALLAALCAALKEEEA